MPVITISRMYGSGGAEVAARVAAALGWTLLDNGIIDEVAHRLGVSPEEVEAREERPTSLAERLANALALASPELAGVTGEVPLPPSEERLLAVTHRVIDEAVAAGNVVLVGRGAQAMLATREDAIHVFCHAPRQALVARTVRRLGITERAAEHMVDETNRAREQFVRKHWKRAWGAPENYDLCLNTERLGVGGAAELIVELARRRFGAGAGSRAADPYPSLPSRS
jgi:cytidylate kinase